MARYLKKEGVCSCCGKAFDYHKLMGYSEVGADLDGNPHNPAVYNTVVMCPHCAFVSKNVGAPIEPELLTFIRSDAYRKLAASEPDDTARKLKLAAAIAAFQDDLLLAGRTYLMLSWYCRDIGVDPLPALKKAVNSFSNGLQHCFDLRAALILCDCLRQCGEFEELDDTLAFLQPYLIHPHHRNIAQFEAELSSRRDREPHAESEVPT